MNQDNLTKKKLSRIIFHVVLFTLFLFAIGSNITYVAKPLTTSTSEQHNASWSLAHQGALLVTAPEHHSPSALNVTYNRTVAQCDTSTLNIHIKSNNSDLQKFVSEQLIFGIHLANKQAIIRINASELKSNEHDQELSLTPFLVNEALQQDLLQSDTLRLELLAPVELINAIEDSHLSVSLGGFQKTYQQMTEFCAVIAARDESTKRYTLVHDVL